MSKKATMKWTLAAITVSTKCVFAVIALVANFANADPVNQGNITTFSNGTPALAGDVNGNFDELIAQINDHANELASVGSFLTLGSETVDVDCDANGGAALQNAIDEARNTTSTLTVNATGTCNGIFVNRRDVIINGSNLTIRGANGGQALVTQRANVNLVNTGAPGTFVLDGNGSFRTVGVVGNSIVQLNDVTVTGATSVQIAVFEYSRLSFIGTCVVGQGGDGTTGLQVEQGVALLVGFSDVATELTINSSGTALLLQSGTYLSLDFGSVSPKLNITGASSVDVVRGAVARFGVSTIVGPMTVGQSAAVLVEGFQFAAQESWSHTGDLQISDSSSVIFAFDGLSTDISVTHVGNINVTGSSSLGIFGPAASSFSIAGGDGSSLDMLGYATLGVANATLAMDNFNLNVAAAQLSGDTQFDDGQPVINVSLNSVLVDNTLSGVITSPVTSCSFNSVALGTGFADRCPTLP